MLGNAVTFNPSCGSTPADLSTPPFHRPLRSLLHPHRAKTILVSLGGLKGTKPEIHPCVGSRGTVGRALTSPDRELSLNTLRGLRNAERSLKMHVSQTEPRHLSMWISDLGRRFDGYDEYSGGRIYECAVGNVILNPGHLGDSQKVWSPCFERVSVRDRLAQKIPLELLGNRVVAANSTFMLVGVGMVKWIFKQTWQD